MPNGSGIFVPYGTSRVAAIPTGRVHRESPGAGSRDEQPADHGFEVRAKASGPAVDAASDGDRTRAVRDCPSQLWTRTVAQVRSVMSVTLGVILRFCKSTSQNESNSRLKRLL
ncbi:hypothetical protein Psi02_55170 [Planotetraspora silvatica]|uniref:Uncharacterized protein n=1 Tax=Planotetraspora silvatica TaxID=234614 RepID=A0A8J3UNA5_9ACTN|nr:hypothetical protein Psi02_55170 [Planotetraspora silvatica]